MGDIVSSTLLAKRGCCACPVCLTGSVPAGSRAGALGTRSSAPLKLHDLGDVAWPLYFGFCDGNLGSVSAQRGVVRIKWADALAALRPGSRSVWEKCQLLSLRAGNKTMQTVPDAEGDLTVLPAFFVFSSEGDKDTASICTLKWQTSCAIPCISILALYKSQKIKIRGRWAGV